MTDAQSNIPHGVEMRAEVNAPAEVTLWDERGEEITVPAEKVDYWLAKGFRRVKADPQAALQETIALFPAAQAAVEGLRQVLEDGVIDPSEEAALYTAHAAITELTQAYGRLIEALSILHPMKQGEAVKMLDQNNVEHEVDPAQVEYYEANGWRRA